MSLNSKQRFQDAPQHFRGFDHDDFHKKSSFTRNLVLLYQYTRKEVILPMGIWNFQNEGQ